MKGRAGGDAGRRGEVRTRIRCQLGEMPRVHVRSCGDHDFSWSSASI